MNKEKEIISFVIGILVGVLTLTIVLSIAGSCKQTKIILDETENTIIFEKETYIPNNYQIFYGLRGVKDGDIIRYKAKRTEYGLNLQLLK